MLWQLLIAAGIPSAITGLLVWYFKRQIEKRDKKRDDREKNVEHFILYLVNTSRATNVLAEATARAVQRIPDAQCNGDMTAALECAAKLQKEEREFLLEQGINHIFGE